MNEKISVIFILVLIVIIITLSIIFITNIGTNRDYRERINELESANAEYYASVSEYERIIANTRTELQRAEETIGNLGNIIISNRTELEQIRQLSQDTERAVQSSVSSIENITTATTALREIVENMENYFSRVNNITDNSLNN